MTKRNSMLYIRRAARLIAHQIKIALRYCKSNLAHCLESETERKKKGAHASISVKTRLIKGPWHLIKIAAKEGKRKMQGAPMKTTHFHNTVNLYLATAL
jgi:hypothetical protein